MKTVEIAFPIPVFNTFHYLAGDNVQPLSRVRAPFGHTWRTGYVVSVIRDPEPPPGNLKKITSLTDPQPLLTPQLLELARAMSKRYVAPLGEVLGTILPPFIKPLKRKKPSGQKRASSETAFLLSSAQKKALKPILESIRSGKTDRYLIEGVTASGKTEIYMHLLSFLIQRKSAALLLVPEIAVTSQLTEMFLRRFGSSSVDVWHSRISAGRKMAILQRLKNGETDILIGTRSAVFAPVKNLGAIIIDEEQDDSYKEGQSPYYDARWVAEKRCEIENAQLIRATATPSVRTYYRATKGEMKHLKMPERIYKTDLPQVTLVDMKKEQGWMFSRYLIEKMEDKIKEKKQIMLFVNRRGFSRSVVCSGCGENVKCSACKINLSMHYGKDELKCHICGRSRPVPEKCPSCGQALFKFKGFGTERVQKALCKFFPHAKIARMDSDTTSRKGAAEKIYSEFLKGKTDILVGTSLIAMGWDFPGVALVGVLDADTILFLPDFRAGEKNYALLKQVAGRSGRREGKGEVVMQSFNPSNYSIKMQLSDDYERFYTQEIKIRKVAGFPPFRELVNIICSHKTPQKAKQAAMHVKDYAREKLGGVEIMGPAQAPRYKIRGSHRWQVILKYEPGCDMSEDLKQMKMSRPLKAVKMKIDIDPYNML